MLTEGNVFLIFGLNNVRFHKIIHARFLPSLLPLLAQNTFYQISKTFF